MPSELGACTVRRASQCAAWRQSFPTHLTVSSRLHVLLPTFSHPALKGCTLSKCLLTNTTCLACSSDGTQRSWVRRRRYHHRGRHRRTAPHAGQPKLGRALLPAHAQHAAGVVSSERRGSPGAAEPTARAWHEPGRRRCGAHGAAPVRHAGAWRRPHRRRHLHADQGALAISLYPTPPFPHVSWNADVPTSCAIWAKHQGVGR